MKKSICTLLLSSFLLCGIPIIANATPLSQGKYETYYQGDPNYVFAYIQMGNGLYIDKSSLQSLVYNPPLYRLSATIYIRKTPTTSELRYPHRITFEYHYDTHTVYFCDRNGVAVPNPIRTDSHAPEYDLRGMAAAEVMWRLAYGMEW